MKGVTSSLKAKCLKDYKEFKEGEEYSADYSFITGNWTLLHPELGEVDIYRNTFYEYFDDVSENKEY